MSQGDDSLDYTMHVMRLTLTITVTSITVASIVNLMRCLKSNAATWIKDCGNSEG